MIVPDARLRDAAELYVATFAGRTDAFAIWNADHWQLARTATRGPDGQILRDDKGAPVGYERLPLTGAVILKCFAAGLPVSTYVLDADSASHIAALDIDREDGVKLGKLVLTYIASQGGIAYLEASRRGCHVWFVLDRKQPGIILRMALKTIVTESGIPECRSGGACPACVRDVNMAPHPDPRIELRPGSDHVSGDLGLDHCIRMPTMPHQKTGARYALISSAGEKLPGKIPDLMLAFEQCPATLFTHLAERAPLPKLGMPPLGLRFPYGPPPVDDSASGILRDLWGVQNAAPGRAVICPGHDDHHPSLSILRDDQRAICKTPGCILNNDGRGRGTNELRRLKEMV